MALGVVGLCLGLIPCVGWIGFPLSGLGLLLGLAGGVVAVFRGGRGVGFPIAGSAICGMALVIGVFWLFVLTAAHKAIDDSTRPKSETSPTADNGFPAPPKDIPNPPDTPPEPSWPSSDKAVTLGDVKVQIVRIITGKVPVKDIVQEDAASKNDLLMVQLRLTNTNPTKKIEYSPWAGKDLPFDRDFATLKDNFGNDYRRITFGLGTYPAGAVTGRTTIYPDQPVSDLLVFELPLASATWLDLKLPAKNYGGDGVMRFRIPIEYVDKEKRDEAKRLQQAKIEEEKRKLEEEKRLQQARVEEEKRLQQARVEEEKRLQQEKIEAQKREEEQRVLREKAEKEEAAKALADAKAKLVDLPPRLAAAEKEENEMQDAVSRLQALYDEAVKKAPAAEKAYFESKSRYEASKSEADRIANLSDAANAAESKKQANACLAQLKAAKGELNRKSAEVRNLRASIREAESVVRQAELAPP
jgi:hypothetical protein